MNAPPGGFADPWPLALEMTRLMPVGSWSLIGGLMVHLHALHAGVAPERPTTDVDVVLHLETGQTTWTQTLGTLQSAGFALKHPTGDSPVHRFIRTKDGPEDVVDVLVADHLAPSVWKQRASGAKIMRAPGGTSALRKTVNCHITLQNGSVAIFSVPNVLGALTLKGGAYQQDSLNRDRHLDDAVVLLSTIDDAEAITAEPEMWTGGDLGRIRRLAEQLTDDHESWAMIRDDRQRRRAQQALTDLARGPQT